jgi:hypothetical protein
MTTQIRIVEPSITDKVIMAEREAQRRNKFQEWRRNYEKARNQMRAEEAIVIANIATGLAR